MDVAVCFIGDEKNQDEVEKKGGERDDGRVSSKSRMVAGGSRGERTRLRLAGCFVKRVFF